MTTDYTYDKIPLAAKLSEDGETLLVYLLLNGVPIRCMNIYVGDQREAFQEAADAGKPKS